MLDLIALSVGAALVAVTLTRSTITRSVRQKLSGIPLIGDLAACPYCMAHWTGFFFAIYHGGTWLEVLVNACIIIGLACGYAGLLSRLWHFEDNRIAELEDMLNEARVLLKELTK